MTASNYCKANGIKSLTFLAKELGVDRRTLQNWYNDNRLLFKCVVIGYVSRLDSPF